MTLYTYNYNQTYIDLSSRGDLLNFFIIEIDGGN